MKEQLKIDYVRGEQVGLLRAARIPPTDPGDGRQVAEPTLKAVLVAIDSRAGKSGTCWASLDTLASDTGLSRRTISRALKALDTLALLVTTTERDGRRWITHRRICWGNLADLPPAPIRSESNAPVRSATGAVRSATGAVRSATGAVRREPRHTSEGTTTHFGGNHVPPKYSLRGQEEHEEESTIRPHGEFLKSCGGEGKTLRPGLEPADLTNLDVLEDLWEIATGRGVLPDTDGWRLTFFALAFRCHRKRSGLSNPWGFFHAVLFSGPAAILKQVDDDQDRKWAKAALDRLDGREPARPPSPGTDPDAVAAWEFERHRQDQQKRLAEWEKANHE